MTEQDKIISKIKAVAYDNVNKKIEEERRKNEDKINNELNDVEKCLAYIKNKLVYKIVKNNWNTVGYELADEDMFLTDYTNDPKNTYCYRGIQFFDTDDKYERPLFKVNDEEYYDIRKIISRYKEDFDNYSKELRRLNENFSNISRKADELKKQEPYIKKLIETYKQVEIDENKE